VLGIWLGLKLTGRQERVVVKEVPVAAGKPFIADVSGAALVVAGVVGFRLTMKSILKY
jgi:hypothetical protein